MNQLSIDGDEYVYLIERANDGTLWAYFPDLPGMRVVPPTRWRNWQGWRPKRSASTSDYYRDRNEPPPPRTHVGAGVAAAPRGAEKVVAGAGRS